MSELIDYVAKGLVEHPDQVQIEEVPSGRMTVFEISVAEDDVGKIIGRQGKIIRALRTVVKASATRNGVRVDVDVV
ncbi:MAG: KH domain-containing protein [Chloroflexi bacterium]|nr:KH domain-containing protein [Chloroflexota bacterium]